MLLLLACNREPTPTAKHVLLVVVDTLRADVVAEAHVPCIDGLAASGTRAGRAWSAGTWTVPSVVSILTGMPVRQHGWDLPAGWLGEYPRLPDAPTVASVLADAGFGTLGLYANPYLAEPLGFDRGFATWRKTSDAAMAAAFAQEVAARWGDGRRHFAYLHPLGPHAPLRPSAEALARWDVGHEWIEIPGGLDVGAAQRNQPPGARDVYPRAYRAAVEDTDTLVCALLAGLGPHRADTAVVLTSDHGEMLGGHGFLGHGKWVWETLTNVPLVVDRPVDLPEIVGGAQIAALVTELAGVPHAWPTPLRHDGPLVAQREGLVALTPDGRRKAIWSPSLAVYDLAADPKEKAPLADDGSLVAARERWEAEVPAGPPLARVRKPAPETVEQLEKLGYVE
ncbi:MAG: sulfatase-like hydrolase/transferase [Myxococcota bacterium]